MFKKITTFVALAISFVLFVHNSHAETQSKQNASAITPSSEFKVKDKSLYTLKPHHQKLQFECSNCHEDAKNNNYKKLETNDCLACHDSKETVARRTEFMDKNHTNPHNSLHDRLDLDCYECHAEHKPSQNLCSFCHNTKSWMNPVP